MLYAILKNNQINFQIDKTEDECLCNYNEVLDYASCYGNVPLGLIIVEDGVIRVMDDGEIDLVL